MDVMSIAATSISLSQMQTAQAVSVAVTRKAMDQMTVPGSHMDILA